MGPFLARWEDLPALRPVVPLTMAQAAAVRAIRHGHDPRGLAACLRQLGQGVCEPLWDRLPAVGCPVLVVHGAADVPYAQAAAELGARLPRSTVAAIAASGHAPHRERPEALRDVIARWLLATPWHPGRQD